MDSQVEVVLPCTHAFCNDCLSEVLKDAEVSSTSAECPYCARNISNEGDGGEVWQLEEWSKDDAAQIAQDLDQTLAAFLEKRPTPSTTGKGTQRLDEGYFLVTAEARQRLGTATQTRSPQSVAYPAPAPATAPATSAPIPPPPAALPSPTPATALVTAAADAAAAATAAEPVGTVSMMQPTAALAEAPGVS
mmetsp:Transcript_104472/g.301180  ORF Transcript_104472/g.301180 Transcript_104472/m.301180 type:complete len:191 (-) Transcript_104472:962-1534(-)